MAIYLTFAAMGAECLHDIKPEGWVLVYLRHGAPRVWRVQNLDHGWHLHAGCLLVNDGMATPKQRMKRKPVVGETLWVVSHGWERGSATPQPVVVSSVGRKYFTVRHPDGRRVREFSLEDWSEVTDYTVSTWLYESKQEVDDEQEWDRLACEIRERFNRNVDLSLNALRNIKLIIDAETQPK